MTFGFRLKLGSSLVVAALLLFPLSTLHSVDVQAQEPDAPAFQTKKKAKPLPPAKLVGKVTTATEIVTGKSNNPILTEASASSLQTIIAKYEQIAVEGGFPKVPKGNYKKGAKSKNVVLLNQRLFMDGYLRKEAVSPEYAERVTSATMDGVSRFQRNMGLAVTGLVDGPTLAALNVPVEQRIRTMQANVARLETYGQNLGDRYLVVNVPSMQIETVNNGKVFSRHNAIVGRPERPTPVVMTALSDINFNPYWNAPASIVENDIFPKLRSGTQILEDMNIKIFQGFGGPEVDPEQVDWRNAIADDYHFRQEPGPASAMATAKINFPSPFGIYLHDTPEKHLFNSAQRFYSSGCVRVEKVDLLLQWILNGQEGLGSSEIGALAETLERRDVKLEVPPQLRVTYLTAWPVGNTVAFRSDVYGLDGTGFVVGQPLPEGEVSDDGQRFVLKPIPRSAKAVEAAEAEGIGLFGKKFGKSSAGSKVKKPSALNADDDGEAAVAADAKKTEKKAPFLVKKAETPKKKPAAGKKDNTPGLFDWAAYRKEQKQKGKTAVAAPVKTKKKITPKKVEAKVAAAQPAEKVVTTKKPAVTAKKVDTTSTAAAKKPTTAPKKVAEACKPDGAGKLPKGCSASGTQKP